MEGLDGAASPFVPTHAKTSTLSEELEKALPAGFKCKIRYVHTAPKRCDPIFSTPPGQDSEPTRLASHFLTASIDIPSPASSEVAISPLVYGVEALVYSTKHLTTIFISKADSTGYLPQQRPSPINVTSTTFIQWLATKERHKHPSRKLVISLFARSQPQYLFPGSAENTDKHILNDHKLIKWWVRVLDPIFPKQSDHRGSSEAQKSEFNGYITVPGCGTMREIQQFLPPHNGSAGVGQHWVIGHPLNELGSTREVPEGAPTRCLLPRFPDDPKARFMQQLDDEAGISEESPSTISPSKPKAGRWSSVRDLKDFWETMAFRQECSSGRVVGFLWLVIRLKGSYTWGQTPNGASSPSEKEIVNGLNDDQASHPQHAKIDQGSQNKRKRKYLSGPIIPREPRLKGGSSSLTSSDLTSMLDVEAGNGLALTQDGYDSVMHTLLHLDFANLDVAVQSTNKWVSTVKQICNIQTDWGFDIVGTAKIEDIARDASANGSLNVKEAINDLGGMVRKKRKAEDPASSNGGAVADTSTSTGEVKQPNVNVLSGSMVRKKPKQAAG